MEQRIVEEVEARKEAEAEAQERQMHGKLSQQFCLWALLSLQIR